MFFGRKIKHLLETRGMSITELADKTGIHRNTIGKLVEGKQENTTTDTIERIAEVFNINPGYFWDTSPDGKIKGPAYTPLEALDLPGEIIEFIKNQKSMGYLVLAKKLEEMDIPQEYVEKIAEAYKTVMEKDKK